MIPTALEKDAFPALASALTFESKSTQKWRFSRKERSDDCYYSVQGGVPQTAPSYELFRKYPRYWGSPKMNIFKIRNETMIATTPHQAGPADRLLIWALSEIPPILGFTKNDTFSNKENLFRPVLGCTTSSGGVQTRVFHKITSCIRYINTNARDLPEKRFFRRRQKPRPPRARTRFSLENFSL